MSDTILKLTKITIAVVTLGIMPVLTLIIYLFAIHPALASNGGIYSGPDPRVPGWERADPAQWHPNKAATAAELIGALLAGPLETLDGDPDVKVHIWKSEETFRAAVVTTNLSDDAIHSEETVIAVKEGMSGWTVTEVWKRWVCRRGENAGKWTNKNCP
jgi:hypothetical protein